MRRLRVGQGTDLPFRAPFSAIDHEGAPLREHFFGAVSLIFHCFPVRAQKTTLVVHG
jgi:hypothetical protein